MADRFDGSAGGNVPRQGQERGTKRWIPWAIGAIALLVILYLATGVFQYQPEQAQVADDRATTGDKVN